MQLGPSVAAIVTGGASGLGEACARALSAHGVRVTLFDMQEEAGRAVAAEIGGLFCRVDVTSDTEVENALDRARAAHGQERILVNCAGIGGAMKTAGRDRKSGTISTHSLEGFDKVLQINLVGSFRCMAKCAAGMLALDALDDGERGVIVNTASVAAEDGQVGQAAYAASKGGLVALTLPVARDLMNEGIRVNTISPGLFNTPLMRSAPQAVRDALAAQVPFPRRLGEPEEFASLVLQIVHNRYFNGAHLRLDGAIRMAPR